MRRRRRIVAIVGTRPEAIKTAPVLRALRRKPDVETILVATGQHGALFDDILAQFGLVPDHRLEIVHSNQPDVMASSIETRISAVLRNLAPDLVLVQGDTTSALAAARAASALGIAVGHIEAGLRSHDLDRPWPEEGNRIEIDRLSTLLFAPTAGNMANLAADPQVRGQAWLTGNSGIDALLHMRRPLPSPSDSTRRPILVTLHRRETIGEPLRGICGALRALAERSDVSITLPVHPNPNVRAIVEEELAGHGAIDLIAPLDYRAMLKAMQSAFMVMSDSGGVQEEAPALGVPLLILRDVTERPEAVACGSAILAGTGPAAILAHAYALLDDPTMRAMMAIPRFPFGRGHASDRIVTLIENYLLS